MGWLFLTSSTVWMSSMVTTDTENYGRRHQALTARRVRSSLAAKVTALPTVLTPSPPRNVIIPAGFSTRSRSLVALVS